MARLPRFMLVGHPQHIIIRDNNRQPVFNAYEDYRFFLARIGRASLAQSAVRRMEAINGVSLD